MVELFAILHHSSLGVQLNPSTFIDTILRHRKCEVNLRKPVAMASSGKKCCHSFEIANLYMEAWNLWESNEHIFVQNAEIEKMQFHDLKFLHFFAILSLI